MKIALSFSALLLALPLFAEARAVVRFSEQRSCAAIRSVVDTDGEALIYSHSAYAPVGLYDIAYVGGCPDIAGSSEPMFVPARDNAQCFVGYRCRQSNRGGGHGG